MRDIQEIGVRVTYKDKDITGIDHFGRLLLIDEANNPYCFDIKEIKFLI